MISPTASNFVRPRVTTQKVPLSHSGSCLPVADRDKDLSFEELYPPTTPDPNPLNQGPAGKASRLPAAPSRVAMT